VLFDKNKTILIQYPAGKQDLTYRIPNSVTTIEYQAFYNCISLTSVYVEWDNPISINANVFYGVNLNNATLYVPAGKQSVYASAPIWMNFGRIVEIANAAIPNIVVQPQNNYNILSVTATVTDGGTLSYQWYSNTTNNNTSGTIISNAINSTYIPPTSTVGTLYYYVIVTNTNTSVNGTQTASIPSSTATITVNVVTSAPELTARSIFNLYPNPVTTELRLESEDITAGDVIRIYTISGSLVGTYIAEGTQVTINVSHLPVGTYVITVGESVQRFVKE
jgi:hypothetical protein